MGSKPKIKIVADTNVLVSAFLWQGETAKIFDLVEEGRIVFHLNKRMLNEFKRVLKYPRISKQILKRELSPESIIKSLSKVGILIQDKNKVDAIKADPSDNMILSCALSAKVDFIVSGDKHLLDLKDFQGIPILSPRQFLNRFFE